MRVKSCAMVKRITLSWPNTAEGMSAGAATAAAVPDNRMRRLMAMGVSSGFPPPFVF